MEQKIGPNLSGPLSPAVTQAPSPTSKSRRQVLKAVAAASTLLLSERAPAQGAYPNRPIRLIVPYPAGGSVDVGIRILSEQMQPILKQQLIVENKPGGVLTIAMQALVQSPVDGYTVLATNTSFVSTQLLWNKFDMVRQLTPLSNWSRVDVIFVASPNAPYSTMTELIAWAKANPGKLSYGSVGPGGIEHMLVANFVKKYGIEAVHVPFKGGPDAMSTLVTGDIGLFAAVIPLVTQYRGRVRPLVVMSDTRIAQFPDVPTIKEAGLDLPPFQFWNGMHMAAGTPGVVIDVLQQAISQALKTEAVLTKFAGIGMVAAPSTPEQLAGVVNNDFRWLADAIKEADVKVS